MWNEKYQKTEFQYGTKPNDYIKQQLDGLPVGRILVPAAGEGRDAVYAAQLGWEVYAFDSSERAHDKALKLASEHKVQIHFTCEDATKVQYPITSFDAIVLTYFHLPAELRKTFHQQCIKWLKPGGVIILEGFHKNQLGNTSGGPKDINWLFDTQTLQEDFNDIQFLELVEKQRILDEGPLHQGLAEVVQMCGRK